MELYLFKGRKGLSGSSNISFGHPKNIRSLSTLLAPGPFRDMSILLDKKYTHTLQSCKIHLCIEWVLSLSRYRSSLLDIHNIHYLLLSSMFLKDKHRKHNFLQQDCMFSLYVSNKILPAGQGRHSIDPEKEYSPS